MDKNTIINQVVNEAYKNLTSLVEIRATAFGGLFGMIIPERKIKELAEYTDEIINNLYIRFCEYLAEKIDTNDMEFILYKSFCYNNPSKDLIEDCFKIVNDNIKKKQSSNETTTLLKSLNSLRSKYNEEDITKALDTIFDILLDYYSIIKK